MEIRYLSKIQLKNDRKKVIKNELLSSEKHSKHQHHSVLFHSILQEVIGNEKLPDGMQEKRKSITIPINRCFSEMQISHSRHTKFHSFRMENWRLSEMIQSASPLSLPIKNDSSCKCRNESMEKERNFLMS